jgi:beta-hydroxylase
MINKNNYPFVRTLETNWEIIKKEFLQINSYEFTDWHEKHLYTGSWQVYPLTGFEGKLHLNSFKCPQTTELLQTIPGLRASAFSILGPKTKIYPHVGYSSEVYRLQLGLTIPEVYILSGIVCNNSTYYHKEGECFIFDDTKIHEAFNYSNTYRTILIVDFIK